MESSSGTFARWLLGATLSLAVIEWVFSFSGLGLFLTVLRLGVPSFHVGDINLIPLLGVLAVAGMLCAGALCWVAVRHWNAPRHIWFAALTLSGLMVMSTGIEVLSRIVAEAQMGESLGLSATLWDVSTRVPFYSPYVGAAVVMGYPLMAWLGSHMASRSQSTAGEALKAGSTA